MVPHEVFDVQCMLKVQEHAQINRAGSNGVADAQGSYSHWQCGSAAVYSSSFSLFCKVYLIVSLSSRSNCERRNSLELFSKDRSCG